MVPNWFRRNKFFQLPSATTTTKNTHTPPEQKKGLPGELIYRATICPLIAGRAPEFTQVGKGRGKKPRF